MDICIITGPFGCLPPNAIGAVEKLWYDIGNQFRKEGHDVVFVSKRDEDNLQSKGCVYISGYKRTGSLIKDLLLDFIYSFKAINAAPVSDIVVLNTFWTPILYGFYKRKFKRAVYNVARFPKKQMFLYRQIDCLACVSSAVFNALVNQTPSLKAKCCVVANPIDTGIFAISDSYKKSNNEIAIAYSGRVHREKGVEILAAAVAILSRKYSIRLKIIGVTDIERGGSGKEYVNKINNLARGYTMEWVAPIYNPKDLANKLSECDVFCYPSLAETGETFGVAPLEAMGLGLVPVVSDLDCFKDFIDDGKNGLVFNHRSGKPAVELAEKIEILINNPKLYMKMSAEAILTSRQFSVERITSQYLLVFDRLLNGKPLY